MSSKRQLTSRPVVLVPGQKLRSRLAGGAAATAANQDIRESRACWLFQTIRLVRPTSISHSEGVLGMVLQLRLRIRSASAHRRGAGPATSSEQRGPIIQSHSPIKALLSIIATGSARLLFQMHARCVSIGLAKLLLATKSNFKDCPY